MDWHLWGAFVLATAVLMAIPGPNVALIVANSVSHGIRSGLMTVAGISTASLVQLALTSLGLSFALSRLGGWIAEIRWLGVAYLVVLGIRQWRAKPLDLSQVRPVALPLRGLLIRALAVSLTNPKTLLFFGAFFPQFMSVKAPLAPQAAILSITYLAVALTIDSGWALLADRARHRLARHGTLRNRLTGGMLVGAGASLALARIS